MFVRQETPILDPLTPELVHLDSFPIQLAEKFGQIFYESLTSVLDFGPVQNTIVVIPDL